MTSKSVSKLQFSYNQDGAVVTKLANVENDLKGNKEIQGAFRNAGISPSLAANLLRNRIPPKQISESDQFSDKEKKILEEHVIEEMFSVEGHEIRVYKIGFAPAAAKHKDDSEIGVHLRDCEIILEQAAPRNWRYSEGSMRGTDVLTRRAEAQE